MFLYHTYRTDMIIFWVRIFTQPKLKRHHQNWGERHNLYTVLFWFYVLSVSDFHVEFCSLLLLYFPHDKLRKYKHTQHQILVIVALEWNCKSFYLWSICRGMANDTCLSECEKTWKKISYLFNVESKNRNHYISI